MEMLATLVLNGEGSRLVGRQSANSELQAFLDNVPTYMVICFFYLIKINVIQCFGNMNGTQII